MTLPERLSLRFAREDDIPLVLRFIRELADYEHMLDEVNITVNKNTIPFEETSPFVTSGIRLGTPSITSRGFTEEDARTIARLITKIIDEREAAFETVRAEVKRLCDKHPLYQDDIL